MSESDDVCFGCVKPADRFVSCCPLQIGGYATGILALVFGLMNLLQVITRTSLPSLLDPSPVLPDAGLVLVLIIDVPYIIIQFALAHFAWKTASKLDQSSGVVAMRLIQAWFIIKSLFFVAILGMMIIIAGIASSSKGSATTPGAIEQQQENVQMLVFSVFLIMTSVTLTYLIACSFIGFLYHTVWSLVYHIEKGHRSLVLLGHNDPALLPGQAGQPPGFVFHSMTPHTNESPSFVSNDNATLP